VAYDEGDRTTTPRSCRTQVKSMRSSRPILIVPTMSYFNKTRYELKQHGITPRIKWGDDNHRLLVSTVPLDFQNMTSLLCRRQGTNERQMVKYKVSACLVVTLVCLKHNCYVQGAGNESRLTSGNA
jgi:hypothetical protein